jgi:response regulator RpfG family c-di-GMP phosphodiesterase
MSEQERPRVLCVDDEPRVVEGLALHLRREYEIHTALSGQEGLAALKQLGGSSVVISDMRMPGMDGATFLCHVLTVYPDTTRILLTGEPGRDAAINAVNNARIFRFLTKPCPIEQLKEAVEAGVTQNRLVRAERSILKETLIGCIEALVDVLAIANPIAFGRASRVKRLALGFASALQCRDFWQLEAAAMLSQIGYLSLPPPLLEKLYYGAPLTAVEKTLADGVPEVAMNLLEKIPRLDPVIQILAALNWNDEALARLGDGTIGIGTRILGLVLEYDVLNSQGHCVDVNVQTLRRRAGRYTERLIEDFGQFLGAASGRNEARQVALKAVQPGMLIAQDIRTHLGTLLVPRGFEVTTLFIERSRNFGPELLDEIIKVVVPARKLAAT